VHENPSQLDARSITLPLCLDIKPGNKKNLKTLDCLDTNYDTVFLAEVSSVNDVILNVLE
jgi:hypothetical protein